MDNLDEMNRLANRALVLRKLYEELTEYARQIVKEMQCKTGTYQER